MPSDDQPSRPDGAENPEDVTATFCVTLVDEWVRGGVTDAVVCPGSRSTPLALALWADDRIRVHVHHDERVAAFVALGLGLASGRPAVVLTTSGTAAAELHPAVVEAHQAGVPLLAVTADRPADLFDVGAAQTIDQVQLFGRSVRWAAVPGVPDGAVARTWRALAARSVAEAQGRGGAAPGPVHLDLAFREPLVGTAGALPPGRPDGRPWTVVTDEPRADRGAVEALRSALAGRSRPLVVAGREPGRAVAATAAGAAHLSAALGAPMVVDARLRGAVGGAGPVPVVGAADLVLRDDLVASRLRPDAVVHVGEPVASRVVNEWIAGSGAVEVRIGGGRWIDPAHGTAVVVPGPAASLADALAAGSGTQLQAEAGWLGAWDATERAAQRGLDDALASHAEVTEAGVARTVLDALQADEHLVVSSSMPIRDVEWHGRPRRGVTVHANRGANGIDGVVSTAVGVALASRRPTACLVGDVALLHDSNALLGVRDRPVDLTVVVVDNDGGGIFSFLPQATEPGGTAFEALFGTPHGVDLRVLAAAHGLVTLEPAAASEVGPGLRASLDAGGVRLLRVATDRGENVTLHRELVAAVGAAARESLGL